MNTLEKKGGWLRRLFRRKKGGRIFGNFLRGIGDRFTAGVYSGIFPKPIVDDPIFKLSDGTYMRSTEYAKRKAASKTTGSELMSVAAPGFFDGLGDVVGNISLTDLINQTATQVQNGDVTFDTIAQGTLDIISGALGDTVPNELGDLNGLDSTGDLSNEQTFDAANQDGNILGGWNIDVELSAGSGNTSGSTNTSTTPKDNTDSFINKAKKFVTDNLYYVIGGVVALGVGLYFIFKKPKKKTYKKRR